MQTTFSLPRVALLALALGTAGVTATFAQTTTPTPAATTPAPTCTAGNWHHHHRNHVLTKDERAELRKAHEAVIAGNGTFQQTEASLKQQFETLKSGGTSTTPAQWQAFHQQKETFHQQLKAAELANDPNLTPIFAKLEAAHQNWHHNA